MRGERQRDDLRGQGGGDARAQPVPRDGQALGDRALKKQHRGHAKVREQEARIEDVLRAQQQENEGGETQRSGGVRFAIDEVRRLVQREHCRGAQRGDLRACKKRVADHAHDHGGRTALGTAGEELHRPLDHQVDDRDVHAGDREDVRRARGHEVVVLGGLDGAALAKPNGEDEGQGLRRQASVQEVALGLTEAADPVARAPILDR